MAEDQASSGRIESIAEKMGALSNAKYRRYWLGSLASVGAIQIATMAQGWLIVDKLGGSALDIGFLGGATAIPAILISLFGGALADRVDRRKLIMAVSAASTSLLLLLAILDSTNVIEIWHVLVIASVQGLVTGFDGPVRSAYFPLLIERKHMASAVMLTSVMWYLARLVTPVIGGLIIASSGTATVFYVGVVGWISMLMVMVSLRVSSPPVESTRNVFGDIVEGVRFILSRRDFVLLIGLTYATHFFGMPYLQLMPLFVKRLGREADGFGILLLAGGLGALAGTVLAGRIKSHPRIGYIMLGFSVSYAPLIAGFAFAPTFNIALALLFLSGVVNTIFFIVAMTVLQLRVPEQMRGRVMGIYTITFALIPLGGMVGGGIASIYDERIAVAVSAAILASIFLAVGLTQPIVRNLNGTRLEEVDSDTPNL